VTTRLRLRLRPFAAKPPRRTASPSRTRRAKVALAVGTLVTLAVFVALALAVETGKPEWRDPEYGHRLKQLRALRAAHPHRPLVVAVGSSRTQMGLSPDAMGFADAPGEPLVFNFGQSAAGPLRLLLTLHRLLDAGVKPSAVLVELFPLALAADGPAEVQMRGLGPKLSAADLRRLAPYCEDAGALRREWASARAASLSSLRLNLLSHWQPGLLPWPKRLDFQWTQLDPHGWLAYPLEDVPDDSRAAGIERARGEYIERLTHFAAGEVSRRAVRDLVKQCDAEGVRVAFYLMPEGPAFRSWYTPATRAAVDAAVAELAALAPVFDATAGFGESDFADSHHLLRGGAARFSKKLADEHLRAFCRKKKE
jgi:hypothetical protein